MGPVSTVNFFDAVLREQHGAVNRDQDYLNVIVSCASWLPSPSRCFYSGDNPAPAIRQELLRLYQFGARVLVVACNTAHIYFSEFQEDLPPDLVLIDIIDEVVKSVIRRRIKRVGLLGSQATIESKVYETILKQWSVECITLPSSKNQCVMEIIDDVKRGVFRRSEIADLASDLLNLGSEAVILGCTEISVLLAKNTGEARYIDSTTIAAKALIECAKKNGGIS